MAQANHATTPRRRAVQSAKCEKSPADAKPLLNGALCALSRSGHGITELAESLADLQKLVTMLANAEGPAERASKEMAGNNMAGAEYAALCRTESHLEDVGRRAHAMVGNLEQVILGLEPRTPDETLSLALILNEELDTFFTFHVNTGNARIDGERLGLEDAMLAIIRGLVGAGATSPLTAAYLGRDYLVPWAEARSTATREATPYTCGDDAAGEVQS